jgi:hypothetical protein
MRTGAPGQLRHDEGQAKVRNTAVTQSLCSISAARSRRSPAPTAASVFNDGTAQTRRGGDILGREYRHKRISMGAYQAGRTLQAVWERSSRIGSGPVWRPTGRVDGSSAHGDAHDRALDNAQAARAAAEKMDQAIGAADTAFVSEILCKHATFEAYARASGNSTSERSVAAIAQRWRLLMEKLADSFAGAKMRPGQIRTLHTHE